MHYSGYKITSKKFKPVMHFLQAWNLVLAIGVYQNEVTTPYHVSNIAIVEKAWSASTSFLFQTSF